MYDWVQADGRAVHQLIASDASFRDGGDISRHCRGNIDLLQHTTVYVTSKLMTQRKRSWTSARTESDRLIAYLVITQVTVFSLDDATRNYSLRKPVM